MQVHEVMTPEPKTLNFDAPLREAVSVLRELDIRHLPIMEGDELVGILSDRDLRELLSPDLEVEVRAERLDAPVSSTMTAGVFSVEPEDNVGEVIDLMLEHKLGGVPVVAQDPPRLVGMVSYVDILREGRPLLVGED